MTLSEKCRQDKSFAERIAYKLLDIISHGRTLFPDDHGFRKMQTFCSGAHLLYEADVTRLAFLVVDGKFTPKNVVTSVRGE